MTPAQIAASPADLTLRAGETAEVKVDVLPAEADQTFTATASNDNITIKE